MTSFTSDPVKFIEQVYCQRREKNPSYSLRAYARFLQISPARLSQILSRTRPITKGQIAKIAIANALTPTQSAKLMAGLTKSSPISDKKGQYASLSEEVYRVLSDVDASALLSALALTKDDTRVQLRFLASKLGLTSVEVRQIIDSLVACKLVQIVGESYAATNANVASSSDVRSSALRRYHKKILEKAIDSIETQNLGERDLSSISLVLDPAKMELAKQKIRDFRRELTGLLETSGKPSEVYALNIQLFKLSK
ncbi:MAG: DUF4423 domain-containing protein [Proteobacteria bacterium]|nr:DUF4423 domain-containing protein [Pseudomonadota bacterium]